VLCSSRIGLSCPSVPSCVSITFDPWRRGWLISPQLNIARCFILPVAFGIFLSIAQKFFNIISNVCQSLSPFFSKALIAEMLLRMGSVPRYPSQNSMTNFTSLSRSYGRMLQAGRPSPPHQTS
jgi:hypothetical protein